MTGELEKRIVDPSQAAPWKYWVPLADPEKSEQEKRDVGRALFDADERTLDSASVRLRRRARCAEALLEPQYQRLLFNGVNKIVLSTASIECLFGQYGQWLHKSPKPLGLSLLAAKHLTHQFSAGGERKRKRLEGEPDDGKAKKRRCTEGLARPAWVFRSGEQGRRNARHAYIGKVVGSRGLSITPSHCLFFGTKHRIGTLFAIQLLTV